MAGEIKGVREGLERATERLVKSGISPKDAERMVKDRAASIDRKIREGRIEKPR